MTLILFITSLSIVTIILLIGYVSIKFQSKKFSQSTSLEIEQLRLSEKNLKNEITTLQNKLSLSLKDPVTNLPTAELFENRLDLAVKESERYQLTMAVFCIDLNDFSSINEAFNYEVGNLLLLEVGKRLQTCIRQVDSIARLQNDVFALLLANLNKPESAVIVAQRILQEFAQPFYIQDHEIYITIYIGIAIFPLDAVDPIGLLNNAKHALSLAKDKNKNAYQFYQKDIQVESQRKFALYDSLSSKSIFQECHFYYQPIVDVRNNALVCVDVLLNCKYPGLGTINSSELFEAAKKQNKIELFLDWLITTLNNELATWKVKGFSPDLIGLSLPIKQLEDHRFIYHFSQTLQKIGFDPKKILLQIKGNFSLVPLDFLEKTFNMLNYIGVNIAIDEFGSAIVPLHYLKLNIRYLKLDSSFAANMTNDKQMQAIIKSIIILAKNLQMDVIAKGVDTQMQMDEYKSLNCFIMQGQLFYPLLNGEEIVEKMRTTVVT